MAEEAKAEEAKWQGKATAKLPNSLGDQIWPLLSDFFTLNKWLPSIDTCTQVEGVPPGHSGCIRYCATAVPSPGENLEEKINWANEKLLSIDASKKCFTYEVLENNIGFKSYVATMKVVEDESNKGCEIEWSFVADPVEGWKFEDLLFYIDSNLQVMAKRMEEALLQEAK